MAKSQHETHSVVALRDREPEAAPQAAPDVTPEAPADEPQEKPARGRGPARKVAGIVLLLFGAALGWHVASDLMAPSSSIGSVVAITTQIAPRVGGEVAEIFVIDNQRVAAGDPLFALDPAPFDLAVRQAEIGLAQARQANSATVASLVAIEARLQQAQSTLESTAVSTARTQEMFERGLSS
jgi:multidrug resistance efflux pump